jgi:class 3 adenylate cyclase/predicted ATPase
LPVKFYEVMNQVVTLLQREGKVSYRALRREFEMDEALLEDLKAELIEVKELAVDKDGKMLVWVGEGKQEPGNRGIGETETSKTTVASSQLPVTSPQPLAPSTQHLAAERRQLTVMFCDLVGSTALSTQLDPEELREIVRQYQQTCAAVIQRYEGYIAQYLGDGLLVYFGYPVAHEDDARRAVRAGLEIIAALHHVAPSPAKAGEGWGEGRLQVRIGIHTGLVVVGEIGDGSKREQLALGETPNIAARIQSLAAPDTVVISGPTQRLVQDLFDCQDLGAQTLKGLSTLLAVYQVIRERETQSRFDTAVRTGLTPLVGRDLEVRVLQERWTQAKSGEGHAVLLSGEPGIGKSRLVQTLKEQVIAEGATRIEFRCSPYHQNSAFYPIIEHLQRLLQFYREESPQSKLEKLQQMLARYRFPQADTVPLLAALLSLPPPENALPITLSPQKQKQKTQEALLAWLVEETERQAAYCTWEDLHWADPSLLEFLTLFLDQVPTTQVLAVLTVRPEFAPPWRPRFHLTQLTLNRLGRQPVEAIVEKLTGGNPLPREVVQQIVAKTDGVSLFVEELTKVVMESVESIGSVESLGSEGKLDRSAIPLEIPATLQDALMARLDRLGAAKEVAQLGATLGREFSYELLRAVSPGYASLEVKQSLTRARELSQQLGETPELFSVLGGLMTFYGNRGEWQTAHKLGEQLFHLAQNAQDPNFLMVGHTALGTTLFRLGELVSAREHLEQSLVLYDPQQHRALASLVGHDIRVATLAYLMWTLWVLGYPDQALKRAYEAPTWAQELSHPFSLAWAFNCAASVHLFRREWQAAQERAEAAVLLSTDQGFPLWRASGTFRRGKALAEQGQKEEGIAHMRQGLTAYRATGGAGHLPKFLSLLAEAYGNMGQIEEGLAVLAKALAMVNKTGERVWEAELYRLKAELTLQQQSKVQSLKSKVPSPQHLTPSPHAEAEECFLKAIEIARKQQAKSLELQAVVSLSRLWQQQGKKDEARLMLAEVYNWFTEGFDTKDLQEAKTLLEELER